MPDAVIVAAARSPIGRARKGSLVRMRPDDLTARMVRAALAQVPALDPAEIDDLMLGCGLPGGEQGDNMLGEIPDVYIAMGQTAENLALARGVTRPEMDRFGVRSQNLAEEAVKSGFYAREITPVTLPDGSVVDADDGPRPGVTHEVVEINEAFAAQVVPSARDLGVDPFGDKLNVHGGAIALGHPYGMTGARITTTLINGLRARDKTIGLETMCVGGQGMATILERLS